ncbi:MAG: VTT domain-containing protein [Cyclobacteriaceae bacterium]
MENPKQSKGRTKFLIRNLLRGFLWLAGIIIVFVWAKNELGDSYIKWLEPVYEKPLAIYSIFLGSEILIGIIPPELFMIWASRNEVVADYVGNVILLASISYLAGLVGHWIGHYLNQSKFYRLLKKNFFGKYERHINDFGGFIVIVAALTPVPFSGIAMLMGSLRYPLRRFLLFALFRFLRFAVYGWVIWEANVL